MIFCRAMIWKKHTTRQRQSECFHVSDRWRIVRSIRHDFDESLLHEAWFQDDRWFRRRYEIRWNADLLWICAFSLIVKNGRNSSRKIFMCRPERRCSWRMPIRSIVASIRSIIAGRWRVCQNIGHSALRFAWCVHFASVRTKNWWRIVHQFASKDQSRSFDHVLFGIYSEQVHRRARVRRHEADYGRDKRKDGHETQHAAFDQLRPERSVF